jgi:hypothetical protein
MSAAALATDEVWGVGRYRDAAGDWRTVELSAAEFEREVDAAEARLRSWGVGQDDIVLLIAGVAEAAQFAPLQRAARRLQAITVTAEPSEFDALRVAAMLARFTLRALIGLDASVLRGLAQAGEVKAILSRCENLIVRDDAHAAVSELGLSPAAVHVLGATVAIECPQRAGAHLDPDAWVMSPAGDRVAAAPAPARNLAMQPVLSDRPGRVLNGPCGCGCEHPRLVLDPR